MKTLKFFTDTETTGLLGDAEQILTFSVVLEKPSSVISAEYEKKIFLKPGMLPNPSALLVNNLNPFTAEYKKDAIPEFLAYEHLKEIAASAKQENYRVLVVAYNAEYDKNMYGHMFSRCGDKLEKHFALWWDPLPTARKLIDEGHILTEEVRTAYKTYRTAKLEAVYKALGNEVVFKAHSALDDTKMLQIVAHSLYHMATGKKLEDMQTHPDSYKVGENVLMVFDDDKIGLHFKLMKILFNDLDKRQVIVLEAETAYNGTATEKAVKVIPYDQILDELPLDQKEVDRLDSHYQSFQVKYTEQVNEHLAKKDKKPVKEADFSEVIRLAEKLHHTTALKTAIKSLSEEEKEILSQAETYALAKYGKGWSREVKGENYLSAVISMPLDRLTLKLDPIGKFILLDGEVELLNTDKRTQIQDKILEVLSLKKEDEAYKALNKQIPSAKEFTNPKHPKTMMEEYERMKGDVFNGANKEHKDLFTDLLQYYKKEAPEVFSSVSLPSFNLNLQSFLKKK